MKIVVTQHADADLMDIHRRIASGSPCVATETIQRIDEGFTRIGRFPFIGRTRPRLGSTIRSLTISLHLVFYVVDTETVRIIRVLDGRRDIEAEFDR